MKNKKRNILKDSLYATVFTASLMYLFSLIPFEAEIINPLENAVGDFQLTDIVFSHIRESPEVEDNITLVNIGQNRMEIAAQLAIINKYNPKVVAIDAFFRHPKDPLGDSILASVFSHTKNLVLVSELVEDHEDDIITAHLTSHPSFTCYAQNGFADMITEGEGNFLTSRDFIPKEEFEGKELYSFPVVVAGLYDMTSVHKLLERGNETEIINFQGNIDTQVGIASNAKNVFTALDIDQVFEEMFEPDVIKDKIVLIGYMGDTLGHNTWEDKFFTPLNKTYIGKANPDMYGVVIHANIISAILKGAYIDTMPDWLNHFLGLILIFLNVWFCCFTFIKLKELYEGVVLVLTFVQIVFLVYLVLVIFEHFNYKFDITFPCIAIFLTGNLVEVYYGIVKVMYNKINQKIDKKYINLRKPKETAEL